MKELLLIGAGGFGRVALEYAVQKYKCAFVDDGLNVGKDICGTKVIGSLSDLELLYERFNLLVVTIGDNKIREQIYNVASDIGYTFPNIIGRNVYISPFAKIGTGCVFLNNVTIQNGAFVGNGVILNSGVEIHNDSFVDDYSLVYTNSVIRTNAKIGKRVKLGSNVTISNGVFVPNDDVINDGKAITTERS